MRRLMWLLFLVPIAGCESDQSLIPADEPDSPPPPVASTFDSASTGRITGRVTWNGPAPVTLPFVYGVPKGAGRFDIRLMPNPNRPTIDDKSKAVAGAVFFLKSISPSAAKPWNLPPVRVEMRDRNILVRQGDTEPGRIGFVRRSDAVTMESKEPVFHTLRGRGADYFSYTFPDPDQPRTRTFDKTGRVELSSGAGFYWASADLLVVDHPYYTLTDRDGRFAFEQVPSGAVEVVAWLPGWDVAKLERDPETGLVIRQTYAAAREKAVAATVSRGQEASVSISLP